MSKRQLQLLPLMLLSLALSSMAAAQVADGSDTMRVGDMQYGNALDPRGWTPVMAPGQEGFSWLHAGMLRTPTGALYPYPRDASETPLSAGSDWTYWGLLQLGYIHLNGDKNAEFFRQYSDWKSGFALGYFTLNFDNRRTGQYVEFRGSRISDNDQYYRLRAGKYGSYKLEAFYRDMPHTVSTNAYPIWNGIGSTNLTLPASLTPGGSTPAQIAAASAAAPRRNIGLTRTRTGLSLEGELYRGWVGSAAISNEERKGTRLWGGPMFFAFGGLAGGVNETVRPIDFSTTDINLSLRKVGKVWRFVGTYNGSFFRNHKDHLDYQSPFQLQNVLGLPQVANIYQGEYSLEPNNDYHNLRLDLSRELKWNGQFNVAAAWGTMRQNDALRPPVTCSGVIGIDMTPIGGPNYTVPCGNWNTTAALSQKNANARIDTGLFDARVNFHPSTNFGWHAGLRWYKEDNKTRYLAYNPLTGQYGYISENGSQGSIVPGETGIFDPRNPLYWSSNVTVRNVPYGYTDTLFELGSDWQFGRHDSLGVTYTFDYNEPKYRERKRVDEHRIKIAWVSRSLGDATIRASYEYAQRRGGHYNYDPYTQFFSESLPGFVDPATGLPAHTVADMRKYDLSDRNESKARVIVTYPFGDATTVSATFYGNRDNYSTLIGRQNTQSTGSTLQWDWQPSPRTTASAYLGIETSRMGIANVGDSDAADNGAGLGTPGQTNPNLGGPLYPYANQWWEFDRERNTNAGFTLTHDFGRVRTDLSYNYSGSLGHVGYNYATIGALAYRGPGAAAAAGDGFPDNKYRSNTLDLGINFDFTRRFGMRLFGRHETGSFTDWHYLGLDQTLSYGSRIYTDKGPQRSYSVTLLGAMFNVKL
ncbi:Putative outer membrane beta-barrel porin, MtrB/PioB [Dyella sp. OK004]|uniref:MtrB/PioB family outer membrane beta-barrel protein n=1 Tax=Dyella sp. OK004 TaxID=1855292 RepID=UPI0008DEE915|nr:MtrB/PioB family outer membrane beta-barrel protein [Dyella sp. OK004]SFS17261.1 Putative outer membrane beta-barrel porin, MtrB/PioB [Dyella sp. OK004]